MPSTTTLRVPAISKDSTFNPNAATRKTAQKVSVVPKKQKSIPYPRPRPDSEPSSVAILNSHLFALYPKWWGHREHVPSRSPTAAKPDDLSDDEFEDFENYPQRMIDEMTQTSGEAVVRASESEVLASTSTDQRQDDASVSESSSKGFASSESRNPKQPPTAFNISPPRAPHRAQPSIVEIAEDFLRSDILACLDLRVLEDEEDDDENGDDQSEAE
ncbi:hypothetical protein HK104_005470 [Borealophlyctis nickersoniae]|nr:hypothetical protein HK104_005470 [Borealophlyctis nickersoniae]